MISLLVHFVRVGSHSDMVIDANLLPGKQGKDCGSLCSTFHSAKIDVVSRVRFLKVTLHTQFGIKIKETNRHISPPPRSLSSPLFVIGCQVLSAGASCRVDLKSEWEF